MAASGVGAPSRSSPALPWATLALAATALAALAVLGASPYARYVHHDYQPASAAGQAGAVALFLAGWTLMLLAMMLPTATKLLAAVARIGGDRAAARRLQLLAAAGFIATWIAVGYAFRTGDVLVHATVDSIGWLQQRPELIPAAVLAAAGLFQFSALKHRCLTACRTPTSFLYRHWHGEHPDRDALRIGMSYGVSCVGCCWALMLVMFGLGTVSLAWMLALATVMAVEKNSAFGARLSAPVGLLLIAAAFLVAV